MMRAHVRANTNYDQVILKMIGSSKSNTSEADVKKSWINSLKTLSQSAAFSILDFVRIAYGSLHHSSSAEVRPGC